MSKHVSLSLAIILIIGAIFFLESRKVDRVASPELEQIDTSSIAEDSGDRRVDKAKEFEEAKEISTPDGFINTDSITISELIGKKVILLDIWTYSCINCQRTIPHLNQWYEKYKNEGLEIIGLHTPEFEFEKDYDNVQRAVEKFGIKYPVVLDNDFSTWNSYKNQYWPRKYLIDIDGFIVYDHIGEGAYDVTEAQIVKALNERRELLGEEMIELSLERPEDAFSVEFSSVKTPEIYLGWERAQYIANFPSQGCLDTTCDYVLPESIAPNTYVLGGKWNIGPESAILEEDSGVIGIVFIASNVRLVVDVLEGPATAEIWLDGQKIKDIEFDGAALYNLIDLEGEYGQHLLEIRIKGKGFSAFAFTFG